MTNPLGRHPFDVVVDIFEPTASADLERGRPPVLPRYSSCSWLNRPVVRCSIITGVVVTAVFMLPGFDVMHLLG